MLRTWFRLSHSKWWVPGQRFALLALSTDFGTPRKRRERIVQAHAILARQDGAAAMRSIAGQYDAVHGFQGD